MPDLLLDRIGVLKDIVHGKPKYSNTLACHPVISDRISLDLIGYPVISAVDLYDKTGRGAEEVGDIGANRMLTLEFEATEAAGSDYVPERALRS